MQWIKKINQFDSLANVRKIKIQCSRYPEINELDNWFCEDTDVKWPKKQTRWLILDLGHTPHLVSRSHRNVVGEFNTVPALRTSSVLFSSFWLRFPGSQRPLNVFFHFTFLFTNQSPCPPSYHQALLRYFKHLSFNIPIWRIKGMGRKWMQWNL